MKNKKAIVNEKVVVNAEVSEYMRKIARLGHKKMKSQDPEKYRAMQKAKSVKGVLARWKDHEKKNI